MRFIGLTSLVLLCVFAYDRRADLVAAFKPSSDDEPQGPPAAELVDGRFDTLVLRPETIESLGLSWTKVAKADDSIPLHLSGKLFIDPNRLNSVHARFAGEVVRLGARENTAGEPTDSVATDNRLRFGDPVKKGQLLAVLWSKEVGDQKSDLVDAVSRLKLDEKTLASLKSIEPSGAIAERSVREAQRNFEADLIQATRAERTLRSWRFSESEIAAIKQEAVRLHDKPDETDSDLERRWAEVEIRSPIDGIIVEHNSPVGDVVEAGEVLFKIADLRKMGVLANLYEDELPRVSSLPPDKRVMQVKLANDSESAPVTIPIERIGDVIDPNQHTVAVIGWIDNKEGKLRSGQFIDATIALPAPEGVVLVPRCALIDGGKTGVMFISPKDGSPQFTRRRVAIVRRLADGIFVRSNPKAEEKALGAEPIEAGQPIAANGVLELSGTLAGLVADVGSISPMADAPKPETSDP